MSSAYKLLAMAATATQMGGTRRSMQLCMAHVPPRTLACLLWMCTIAFTYMNGDRGEETDLKRAEDILRAVDTFLAPPDHGSDERRFPQCLRGTHVDVRLADSGQNGPSRWYCGIM